MKVFVFHPTLAKEITSQIRRVRPHTIISDHQLPHARAFGEMKTSDILLGWEVPLKLLNAGENLKWIQSFGAGVENFVKWDPVVSGRVTLTKVMDLFGDPMAQYVLTYVLFFSQKVDEVKKNQKNTNWQETKPRDLRDQTMGILGVGSIGSRIAKLASSLGLRVLGASTEKKLSPDYDWVPVDELARRSDYIVVTLPVTPRTDQLIDYSFFSQMKNTAIFLNIGRGRVLVEGDLIRALDEGQIKSAVLDVFKQEPLPSEHPFWSHKDIVVTPHMSGQGRLWEVIEYFIRNLDRFEKGEKLDGLVNPQKAY